MKITKRQLRRIIREAMPSGGVPDVLGTMGGGKFQPREEIDLYLDLGSAGDFPTLTDSETGTQWEVPYFTSAEDFLDEVLSQLPGSTPDTIVYGEEMDLPDLPLSQVWDAVMVGARR